MPKRKSVASVEAKIKVTQQKIVKAKARYDRLCAELSDLKHERDEAVALEILSTWKKSGKSYRELMTFLGR